MSDADPDVSDADPDVSDADAGRTADSGRGDAPRADEGVAADIGSECEGERVNGGNADDAHDGTHVVTCVVRAGTDVLLLRRSDAVGSYAGRWGMVAGHAEGAPADLAWTELAEEAGLADDCTLVRAGEPFPVDDPDHGRWVVHPFLFESDSRAVETDGESVAHEWVSPVEIRRRETVPELWTSYERVAPTVETVRDDREHGSTYLSVRALEVLRDRAAVLADAVAAGDRDAGAAAGELAALARDLRAARPAMWAVANRTDRAMAAAGQSDGRPSPTPAAVLAAAEAELDRAERADDEAARAAAALDAIAGATLLTLSRSGSVRATLTRAAPRAVYVAESRPAREGVAVAEALADETAVTLHVDAAAAHVLATHSVDAVVVGADAVLPDGRVVNKVGTRGLAVAAAREGVPVYAVAATDKVVPADVDTDVAVDLEPGPSEAVYDGDADLDVATPTFDVTPADLVTVVTERGPLDAEGVREVAADLASARAWDERRDGERSPDTRRD